MFIYISSSSKIYNCSNIGDVTTTNNKADSTIAGICGTNYEKSEIKYCYNIGEIAGKSNYTGGIVGTNYLGIIEECYNTGALSALEGESIGGIVGYQYADEISNEENTIKNCYNTAGIESQVANAGGICGNAKTGIIENCYNASKNIVATGENIGGIVGIGRDIEGVEVSIFLREVENGCKASLRSNEYVNVSDVCILLGGGGHLHAAGATMQCSIEQAKEKILRQIKAVL